MYDDETQLDVTQLRYVLYTRKSTDDPQRQIRSRDDQKAECRAMAARLGIRIVATIGEDGSAKKPGKRPVFNQLMKDLYAGKYDGIVAWHPDRLARNMKEGGEIIDMIDNAVIKDLKFVTYTFTPDHNGKMLLGMAFVLSKQYSDKLSVDVTRGVRRNLNEGKSAGTFKHGYERGEDGIYQPDGKNFELICDAWTMRAQGKSLEVIAEHMNDNGYARVYKDKAQKAGEKSYMNDKTLSARVFPDPFYYGILIQKGKPVDLRDIPGYNFQPATDQETYEHVQALTGRRSVIDTKRKVFKPLTSMVVCYYCKHNMTPQTPTSSRKDKAKILSYRCDAKHCPRNNKELNLAQSVRAITIFNFMYDMLENFNVTRDDYDRLSKKLATRNKTKQQELAVKIHSKQAALKSLDRDIKERSLKIITLDTSSPIYETNEAHINDLSVQRQEVQDDINKLEAQVSDQQQDLMSFQDFLNVANNASKHLRAANVAAKDRIARLIYLNVTVDTEKVVDYQIREPFRTYFQMHEILDGRGDRT